MSGRSGYTGEGGESIMSWPRSPSPTSSEVQVAPALCTTVEFEVPRRHVGVISIGLFWIVTVS